MNKSVRIREHVFKDAAAARSYFGLTIQTIYKARRLGRLDKVGLGSGGDRGNLPRATSVTIDGATYPTLAEAKRKTGISYYKLRLIAEAERKSQCQPT